MTDQKSVSGASRDRYTLILHILGALKHQFIDKQSEFARMLIGRRRQS